MIYILLGTVYISFLPSAHFPSSIVIWPNVKVNLSAHFLAAGVRPVMLTCSLQVMTMDLGFPFCKHTSSLIYLVVHCWQAVYFVMEWCRVWVSECWSLNVCTCDYSYVCTCHVRMLGVYTNLLSLLYVREWHYYTTVGAGKTPPRRWWLDAPFGA